MILASFRTHVTGEQNIVPAGSKKIIPMAGVDPSIKIWD